MSPSSNANNLIVKVEILRNGSIIAVNEQVSFNSGTTYSGTSSGNSNIEILTGDIIRLLIDQVPANISDAPKGLTATLKLKKA